MVLPASAPDDEPGPRQADWIEQIKLGLRLSRAGILIHVDDARMERLGELVRALVAEHPELDVHTEVRDAEVVPEGSVMVVVPKAADAEWLNLRRPLFARKSLKVVLFCDREMTHSLAERAVDFFDWVSQHHECPPGPVPHAVHGLRCAAQAEAPGVLWIGSGKPADGERMWSAFSAALPGETLRWVIAKPRPWNYDHQELVDQLRAKGEDWIACRIDSADELRRLRWGLAEAGRRSRVIALAPPHIACPGWWSIDARLASLVEARRALQEAGSSRPGSLAALTDLEPAALELVRILTTRGMPHRKAVELLRDTQDPGVVLALRALDANLVDRAQVAEVAAPLPALRALSHDSEVRRLRARRLKAIGRTLKGGGPISFEAAGFWAATALWPPRLKVRSTQENEAISVFLVESQLRLRQGARGWTDLASQALRLGDADVARAYAWRAVRRGFFLGIYNPALTDVATQLTKNNNLLGRTISSVMADHSKWPSPDISLLIALATMSLVTKLNGFAPGPWTARALFFAIGLVCDYGMLRLFIGKRRLRRALAERSSQAVSALNDTMAAAVFAQRRGEYERARVLLKEVLATSRDELYEEHPIHRLALQHLAMNAAEDVDVDDVDALHEIERALKLEGQDAVHEVPFALLIAALAGALCKWGGAVEAEALLRKLLGPELPRPQQPDTGQLTEENIDLGLLDAEARELVAIFLSRPGPSVTIPPEIKVRALRHLVEALSAQGRYEEAEQVAQIARERAGELLPAEHPEQWRALAGLGQILALEHRHEDARHALNEAVALAEETLGQHIEVARLLRALAIMKWHMLDMDAADVARRALAAYAEVQCGEAERETATQELKRIDSDMGSAEDGGGEGAVFQPAR